MKKYLLLFASLIVASSAYAAFDCTKIPTCADLGFTMSATDCAGKNMLKCPFETDKVFCGGEITGLVPSETCKSQGYTSSCSGESKKCTGCNMRWSTCPSDSEKCGCIKITDKEIQEEADSSCSGYTKSVNSSPAACSAGYERIYCDTCEGNGKITLSDGTSIVYSKCAIQTSSGTIGGTLPINGDAEGDDVIDDEEEEETTQVECSDGETSNPYKCCGSTGGVQWGKGIGSTACYRCCSPTRASVQPDANCDLNGDGLIDGEEMAFCMHNGGGVGNVGSGIGGGTPDPIDIIIENLNNSSDDSCYKLECTVAY